MGKNTPRDERRDPETDQDVSLALEGVMRGYGTVCLASRWGPGVIYRGVTKDPIKTLHFIEDDEEEADSIKVWVPEWRHTGDRLKTFAWIMVLSQEGTRARTMNFNLGPEVIGMARRAAETRGIGFASSIRERVTKHLKRELEPLGVEAPDFFLWIEAVRESKAHVHGGIIIPDCTKPVAVMRAIRKALKSAGGNWNPAEHENQVRIGKTPDAGWGRYVSKWKLLTRLQLQNDNTVAATSGLRSRAAAWYKHARTSGDPIKSPPST
jgi:hypothetical protein